MMRAIILFISAIMVLSCSTVHTNLSANDILPRKAYVFIKIIVNLKRCTGDVCETGRITAAGSGFIIKTTYKGSFIMTASHVCATDKSILQSGVEAEDKLKVETLDGRNYDAVVLTHDPKIDACLMFAEDLVSDIEEVKLSDSEPKEGDKVYNIASPHTIHFKNIVPIFEGRYIGQRGVNGFYTFDAAPGSSGSMILNEDGELIGLLHSVFIKMHSVVVSVRYRDLMHFIKRGLIEHAGKQMKELHDYNKYILER